MTTTRHADALFEGYNLLWYEIRRVIGKSEFGITYLARDNNLKMDVAIKEYLPEDFASRIDSNIVRPKSDKQQPYSLGMKCFIDEARTLARFIHPNIVHVLSVVEQNATAYMVMEYVHGEDLSAIYTRRAPVTEEQYLNIFIPIMDGLGLIHHAGYIHHDIKPANIYICANDTPILLGFGSARQSLEGQYKARTNRVSSVYAPFEHYKEDSGKLGPWTDIYALGASMYEGITGKKPVDVLSRGSKILNKGIDPYRPVSVVAAGRFTNNFLLAIDNALMFQAEDRPQDIKSWANMLLGKAEAPVLPDYMLQEEAMGKAETVSRIAKLIRKSRHSVLKLAVVVTIVFAVISVVVYIWQQPADMFSPEPPAVQDDAASDPNTARIADLLARAKQKQQQGHIFEPVNDNAFYYYSQIRELGRDHKQARDALSDIHLKLIDRTRDQIEQQKHEEAELSFKLAEQLFPGHEQHAKLKDLLQEAIRKQKINQLLGKAASAMDNKQLTTPLNDNAYYYYKRVIELDPDNSSALKRLEQLENTLLTLVESSIKINKPTQAAVYLEQLDSINPDSKRSQTLHRQIKALRVKKLLSSAEIQYSKKHYTIPKDDNAYDTYQQILAIDPGNQQAKTGIANIKNAYKKLFDDHIAASRLSRAQDILFVMERIAGDERVTRQMKKILADAEHERINDLIAEFKTNLESRNQTRIKKISQFVPGREQFVEQLLGQYRTLKVTISDYRYIAQNHEATANVELSDLIDKNGNPVIPGSWSKFSIRIAINSGEQFKVYW